MRAQRRQLTAGVVLLFGVVYLVFEFLAARAWTDPPYDWARNYISDLGFADCALVGVVRICSPLYSLMNAAFMIQGTVFTVGSILVVGFMLTTMRSRWLVGTLMVISGVGTFFVGVFNQSLALYDAGLNGLHFFSAFLAIGPGNIGILLLGILVIPQREWRGYGIAIVVIGIVGVIASLLLLAKVDFELGIGLVERVAVYPLNAWTIGTGVGLVTKSIRDRMREKRA